MNIVMITPGAGGMYCGNCFRDNALVAALRRMGHQILMVPLYLPMTLEEEDQSAGTPLFFNGLNVYLDQKSALYRKAPGWLRDALSSPTLLAWAASKAAKTRAQDVGDVMLSMIRGEEGNQVRELEQLVAWLKTQSKPDVVCLSNALLVGLARRLKEALGAPVVCFLQGEDSFLDTLAETQRVTAWQALAERARDIDLFVAPSAYFGELMKTRLGLAAERLRLVHNGINLEGYSAVTRDESGSSASSAPVLGYFARMCKEKGLHMLVDAFLVLKERPKTRNLRLRVGGGCGPSDEPFVEELRRHLGNKQRDVQFFPNVDRAGKIEFLHSLTVFSTPALYGEAFGLYVIEALAAGVPVVQPRHGAFPELIAATGGGVLCDPTPEALADGIENLLLHPLHARHLAERGRKAVFEGFSIEQMAANLVKLLAVSFVRP